MLVSSQTDFSLYVGSTTSYHPKLSWWTAEQRKVRRRNMWREARLWYLSIRLSGVFRWGRRASRCVSVVWSSCISGGQAWWLQIQVPNYSRSDAIISLSKEMIFYLLEECNPFHDDYFWEDILGVICSHLNLPSCSAAASEHTVHYKSSSQLFKSNQLETVTSLDPCAHIGQEIRFFECCILFFFVAHLSFHRVQRVFFLSLGFRPLGCAAWR